MSSTFLGDDLGDWRAGSLRLSAVVGAHLLLLFVLIYNHAVAPTLSMPAPIMVSLIKSPDPEPVPPVEIPKPKKVKLPDPPKKVLVAESTRPSPTNAVTPPEPPAPAPPAADKDQAIILPDVNAAYLDNPRPPYPPLSRRNGEEGKVLLRVVINTSGLVDAIAIDRSSGFSRLDTAALETVRKWKFTPGRQGSRLVVASVIVPVSFSLVER
jgi:protein TonB